MIGAVDGALACAATVLAMHGVWQVPFDLRGAADERNVVQIVDGEVKFEFRLSRLVDYGEEGRHISDFCLVV